MVKHISKEIPNTVQPCCQLHDNDGHTFNLTAAPLDDVHADTDLIKPVSIITGNFNYVDSEFIQAQNPDKYAMCIRVVPGIISAGDASMFTNEDGLITLENIEKVTPYPTGDDSLAYPYRTRFNNKDYVSAVGFINDVSILDPDYGPVLPEDKELEDFSIGMLPVQTEFYSAPPSGGVHAQMGRTTTHAIDTDNNNYINLTQLYLSCGTMDLYPFSHSIDIAATDKIIVDIDTSLFNIIPSDLGGNVKAMLPRIGGQMISLLSSDPAKMYVKDSSRKYIYVLVWDIGVVDLTTDPEQ